MAYNGLKMGTFHLFWHPKCSGIIFGKHIFDPFLTLFFSQKAHFQGILGFSEHQNGPP